MNNIETALKIKNDFIDNLSEHIENTHLINAVESDAGACLEIARNYSADVYIYLCVVFDVTGFIQVNIQGKKYTFDLYSEEIENIISDFQNYGYLE